MRTVADLVEHEKLSCRAGTDLSRKLIGLSFYLEEDSWKNDLGEPWSLRHVIHEELSRTSLSGQQEITRLLGLSSRLPAARGASCRSRASSALAKTFVDEFQEYVFRTQGSDGSWALRPPPGQYVVRDFSSQLLATGLVAEWLAASLPESRLEGAAMVKAIDFLELRAQRSAAAVEPAEFGQPRPRRDDFRAARLVALRRAGVSARRRGKTCRRQGRQAGRRGAIARPSQVSDTRSPSPFGRGPG